MNSKNCPLRQIGQRSISSTFLFRASNRSSDCERNVKIKALSRKGSRLSLSDFLNKKLHRVLCYPHQFSGEHSDKGAEGESVKKIGREAEAKFSIDGAFDMFKNVEKDKEGSRKSCSTNETEIFYVDDIQQTRKRKKTSEGHDDKPTARKRLVVLGEDSKPVQCSRRKNFVNGEPKPLFNHYENGGGWWNDNMEGVDNEEVGCNDVWEGVGCTTLGGIEWH
ncbi:hypothetical protein DH2020_043481 [Rehmannia glutinosa]|uniref:Uncharacterized protein n=1 Tax=Rehmannia glutinosa TaxID=99300 RepID=A0ABR0UJI6_REHGL